MFILNNLTRIFQQVGHSPGIHKSLLDGIDNPDNFKVLVLRNPVDTILSLYAHTKIFRQHTYGFDMSHFKIFISDYVKYHEILEKHLEEMHVYSFENLEDVVLDIASKFVLVPENYEFVKNEDLKNNPASVTSTDIYKEAVSKISDYSIFDPAFEIYNRLMQKASIIV